MGDASKTGPGLRDERDFETQSRVPAKNVTLR